MAEGETTDLRKVTILVSDPDPDATDSSSDEADQETRSKRPKRVVREVFIHQVGKSGRLTEQKKNPEVVSDQDLGSGTDTGPRTSSRRSFPGVRKRRWGRWCAEIRNPFEKRRVWLGTFNSKEEASRAYLSKKLEFERIAKAKQEITRIKIKRILPFGVHINKGSGKYCSEIAHPIGNEKIFLGTFDTVEEASQAIQSKKLEMEESKVRELEESKLSQCEESEVVEVGAAQSSDSSCDGARPRLGEEKDDEDEGMWLGKWVPMPDGTEVNFSVKYGIPIIDNYGYLLGEFRRLDDDLWICRPEDDD